MRFILKRTSVWDIDTDDFGLEGYTCYEEMLLVVPNFIEFETLDDLLKFEKEMETEIIIYSLCESNKKEFGFDEPVLEIYDSYRE